MSTAQETAQETSQGTPELDSPFWAFSLAVYAGDGVAEECLGLQERLGLDVNLLLFAAYMGAAEGVRLAPREVASANAAVAEWHSEIVRPMRAARRALKAPATNTDDPLQPSAASLRLNVKRAELEAEKIEQAMLWRWSRTHLHDLQHDGGALAANLREVLALAGDADAPSPHLIEASIAYAAR
jgi:uncharacterized protein (TIGR02444 family)